MMSAVRRAFEEGGYYVLKRSAEDEVKKKADTRTGDGNEP